jgi:hypothetical protein
MIDGMQSEKGVYSYDPSKHVKARGKDTSGLRVERSTMMKTIHNRSLHGRRQVKYWKETRSFTPKLKHLYLHLEYHLG